MSYAVLSPYEANDRRTAGHCGYFGAPLDLTHWAGFSDQAADVDGPKAAGTRHYYGAPHAPRLEECDDGDDDDDPDGDDDDDEDDDSHMKN